MKVEEGEDEEWARRDEAEDNDDQDKSDEQTRMTR